MMVDPRCINFKKEHLYFDKDDLNDLRHLDQGSVLEYRHMDRRAHRSVTGLESGPGKDLTVVVRMGKN